MTADINTKISDKSKTTKRNQDKESPRQEKPTDRERKQPGCGGNEDKLKPAVRRGAERAQLNKPN